MKRISVLAVVAAFLAAGVAGCGDREQTALYKDGKYRGKPDTPPWDNGSWENQLSTRHSNSQNENRRIGH